jgi:hypothetical protein
METIKDLVYAIGSFFADKIRIVIVWFMELNIFNKIIVINTVTCFFAIALPIAKYYIFESWRSINNPVAIYLIFVTGIMLLTIFLHGLYVLAIRVIFNLWFLLYVIYMYSFNTISQAPYEISTGFAFNLIAPIVYIAVSVFLYLSGEV